MQRTLERMTLDQKIGQLISIGIESGFTATDSAAFEQAAAAVRDFHIGAVVVFGVTEPSAGPMANASFGGPVLGQPLAIASMLNRLQMLSRTPLLVAADFEFGLGMRIAGGTTFPRAMAFGAAGNPRWVEEAARVTAAEARAIGVHLNLAPVADINSNPRNPVINTRSFGESAEQVGPMVAAAVRGLQANGMLATLKHFPGHGDTAVDSHLGLPLIPHARDRLDALELKPFVAGIEAGAAAVMTSHITLPALDPRESTPATFSDVIATRLLRQELRFDGLLLTDSMKMAALAKLLRPRDAAVMAIAAGHDLLLDVPSAEEAFFGIGSAIERGDLSIERLDRSVTRLLRAKARLGLHRQATVSLDAVADRVGGRRAAATAAAAAARAVTLIRDEGDRVPLRVPATASVLYLSVLDYPAGWGVAQPSRVLAPALRARWPRLTAIELTDRTPASELETVAASFGSYDAIVAGVFVRTASGSGRMDLPASLAQLLNDAGRQSKARGTPMVAALFGNPYTAAFLPEVPALMLAYDYYDLAERAMARALNGEAPVSGAVPVTVSDEFSRGLGLRRAP